jgi:hypothetical protein
MDLSQNLISMKNQGKWQPKLHISQFMKDMMKLFKQKRKKLKQANRPKR